MPTPLTRIHSLEQPGTHIAIYRKLKPVCLIDYLNSWNEIIALIDFPV